MSGAVCQRRDPQGSDHRALIRFDGNDIVDLPASSFERLRRTDSLLVPNHLSRFYQGRLPDLWVGERLIPGSTAGPQVVALPRPLTGTVIRIDVE